jgi:hypothetical protein
MGCWSGRSENVSDQRLVRCIAWFCGELSVLENKRKATDYEYERGVDSSDGAAAGHGAASAGGGARSRHHGDETGWMVAT